MADLMAHLPDNGLATLPATVKAVDGSDQPGRVLAVALVDVAGRASGDVVAVSVTIPEGEAESGLVVLSGAVLAAVLVPAGWGTSTPGNIGFLTGASEDGSDLQKLYDRYNYRVQIETGPVTLVEDRRYSVDPRDFMGAQSLKLVCLDQSVGTDQNVSADRTLIIHARVL